MRKLLTLLFSIAIVVSHAQEISVKGKITDSKTGEPIPGVSVLIKDTLKGTETDFDGNYTISVKKGEYLVFNSLGYAAQTILVENNLINVFLVEDTQQLEEVVIIGYGKKSKKDVTGAVSLVESKVLEELKPVDASLALQGTSTGISVNQASGSPGGDFNILIRGISSNSSNGPLVVIDGLAGANLNTLNPSDIESVTVLKDAQAAIYGIQGANGVILVTTKSGRKNGKMKITYDGYTGIQETSKRLNYLNATEYAFLLNESYAAAGQTIPFPDVTSITNNTDWQDQIFTTAFMSNHNISVSGGAENMNYYLGASRLEQDGIIAPDKSNFIRNNIRLTLGIDLSDKVKLSTTTNYFTFDRKAIAENGLGSVLFNALNYAPTFALDQEDSSGFLGNEVINPLSQIRDTYNEYFGSGLEGMFKLEYKPFSDVTITSRIGYKTYSDKGKTFLPIVNYGSGKVFNRDRSQVDQSRTNSNNYNWETFINYKRTFYEDHNVDVTLGTSMQKIWGDGLFATGFDVPNNAWEFADIALADGISDALTNGSFVFDNRLLSYFARIQYDFKGKYLISGMIRRDAASDFTPENRVDYFPSVTGGWKVSEEEFMKDLKFINFLKLRASYGFLGNNAGGNLFRARLDGEATYVLNDALVNGVSVGRLPNTEARWERGEKLDIGFDVTFLNNKLEISGDYFREDRNDLLIANLPVSGITGISAPGSGGPTVNAGTSRVKGFEFVVKYKDQIGDDFSYDINYNVTRVNGEVTAVNGGVFLEGGSFGVGQPAPSRMEVGQPIGYFYGLQTDGVFQTVEEINSSPSQAGLLGVDTVPGDLKFVDVNGDGVINFDDKTNIGNPQAEFIMGLNLGFKYKNWDFKSYMYAELNKDMVRNYERNQPNVNRLALYLDRWRGPGTSNEVPRVTTGATNNSLFSSFYVEDASFLRIQNIQIGYSLPQTLLDNIGFSRVRLYTTVNNLFTFTNYNGFDPASSAGSTEFNPIGSGIDGGVYPVSRQYILGLNLAF
ncbi:TonB-dependent receptor [uncultured Tenacibaculum sp.]|uniref:SusC/RagA family TonB-linked outer membrane protein n=1 Tax=uncultured Tenacibaculum sp. TaxID=174713 RepID=UPI00262615C7|nr:TonB-dependent receptor [uncultured Tenacibaculum sp.]